MTTIKKLTTEKIFKRYESLAIQYANKIWNENKISLEKEDLYQEMRIKLFLAIKTYAQRWREYREDKNRKPIPLEFYLRTTMANKVRDFIAEISSAIETETDLKTDRGVCSNSVTEYADDLAIGGDLLSNLFQDKYEKRIFQLLVENNFCITDVLIISNNKILAEETCEIVLSKIREYLKDNATSEYQEFFVTDFSED